MSFWDLGSGTAGKAKKALSSRQDVLDKAIGDKPKKATAKKKTKKKK